MYDHVFDIELGDGVMRKLPFDNGQNPLEAADKFIIREGLNRAYIEQIANHIRNHSLPMATSDFAEQRKNYVKATNEGV